MLYPNVDTDLIKQLMSYCTLEEAENLLVQMEGTLRWGWKWGGGLPGGWSPPQPHGRNLP